MAKVTFIEASGTRRTIEAKDGEPLMYAARDAGIAGIIAECGGAAMCATCHCHLVEAPEGSLTTPLDDERDTIEFLGNDPRPESRLICQIKVTPELAGAVFKVATGR